MLNSSDTPDFQLDVVIIGGCGRVGLPLAIAFAKQGLRVCSYDVDEARVKLVNDGNLPFDEPGAAEPMLAAVDEGRLSATTDASVVGMAENVVVVIGTPVDEHLNPDPNMLAKALQPCDAYFRDGQLVVLRSTLFPGVTDRLIDASILDGREIDVAFCPERILEGHAMEELYSLPQIIGARNDRARHRAAELFGVLTDRLIYTGTQEAELAKLFANVYRYIKFATVNQFYMIANERGLDFEEIRRVVTQDYPRAADMPRAGFAAGPCLFKDTMQLAAFNDNNFALGHAAMLVNEGLPLHVVSRLEQQHDLSKMTVGVLGMAFKGGSDDTRESLSYKLKRILRFKAAKVLTTDPYVTDDPDVLPLEEVLDRSDLLIIATPHPDYRELRPHQPVADIWGMLGAGVRV
ncbi:UDP-N-acetyl-D-mannosaminuronic acid dehydrogenase [Nocardioides thalensis]|uniref:UDP-N-acetyl-D-mannosaminuronic acid dehydrogenase n=1 Tax=Nocardioides thalensis TaxID=1914755 RepID=A0A853C6X0_9ACTN|nr:nucleotide sugar dehydrogenase [Nocardioides thalensis]NYJ02891.1 UDP-N-acetyl-D-mannosaminuronic acid dehydrogenase [Nocardioides thalensis]